MSIYICPRCGNSDPKYLGKKNGRPYCRLCVTFQGKEARDNVVGNFETSARVNYPLSNAQDKISQAILSNFLNNHSVLIHAVCGSGKTELVYRVIGYALSKGMHVGFAVPRREVVIDLLPRFKSAFPNRSIISVYGGNTDKIEADFIILTTHQLYRYNAYFDILILDEIDAFPFRDNHLLINLFNKSIRGSFIMMSATPPDDIVKYFTQNNLPILELHTRYHQHPLPVPEVKICIGYLKIIFLVKKLNEYKRRNKQVMIFTPTIHVCERTYNLLRYFNKNGTFVHSKCIRRAQIIDEFKKGQYRYLLTTSVLERGVTIRDVQVIIYDSDNDMYDKGVLVQIAGRVGRKIDAPSGEVIFLANKKSPAMLAAIKAIKHDNSFL